MLQWYSIFSLFYLFLFVLICLFHCVFWLSSLCLFEWSALIWSVPSWALVVLEFRAFVFVYFDLVFAFCSNLLCLVSEKMGCIGRKYLCFSMETQFKVHIFLGSLWNFILKVQVSVSRTWFFQWNLSSWCLCLLLLCLVVENMEENTDFF
jgi:hypothetical protein